VLLVKRGEIGTGLELLRTAFAHLPQHALSLLNTLFRRDCGRPRP
jgi:hypothetical protein